MKNSHFEISIDPDANCVFARHFGLLDMDSILARGNAVRAHKDFRKNLNRVVDTTNCELDLCSDEIRRIADKIAKQGDIRGCYKEALLVDSLLSHGLARVFDSLSTIPHVKYEIFSSADASTKRNLNEWLDLPADYEFPEFLSIV
ncbi:MAG: hypothetical protein ABJN40_03540 [Sneathiella sp.]